MERKRPEVKRFLPYKKIIWISFRDEARLLARLGYKKEVAKLLRGQMETQRLEKHERLKMATILVETGLKGYALPLVRKLLKEPATAFLAEKLMERIDLNWKESLLELKGGPYR